MSPKQVILALGPAAVVAGIAMVIAWWPWRRDGGVSSGHWGGALGIGLAFICGFMILTRGWPGLPPKERWQWLLIMSIAAMVIGLVAALCRARGWKSAVLGMVLAVTAGLLIHPTAAFAAQILMWRVGLAALTFVSWLSLEKLAERRPGASLPLALWVVFCSVSVVLIESRFATLALIAASVAAALGAVVVIAWLNPRVSLARGASHVIATLLAALLVTGWFYNRSEPMAPLISYVLLAIAPMALWIGELKFVRQLKPWQAAAIRLSIVLMPVAVAAGIAVKLVESAESDPG